MSNVPPVQGIEPRTYDFEDQFFLPLMAAYRSAAFPSSRLTPAHSFRSGKVPSFLLWSEPLNIDFWLSQLNHLTRGLCPLPCDFTFNVSQMSSVDAVVVYLRGVSSRDHLLAELAPRDPTQPWIVSSFEAPPLANSIHHTDYRTLGGIFNRTMLYRRDADVVVPHGFIVRRDEASLLPKSWHVPPVQHPGNFHTRKMVVAFISNCHAKSDRLEYIRALKKYITVDIFGKCGNLKCGRSLYVNHRYDPTKDRCLKMAGERYLFYLAFENSLCTDYVTEKLYNLMYYPMVPVVLGAANYSAAMPPNSYIDARQYTPRELATKLKVLARNPQKYQKYLAWRQYYQPSTIGGERSLCHLCVRLHDPGFYKHNVIDDFYDWFVVKSQSTDGHGPCL
ncbi:4-galactosyl-N-acetylglucosaminide 3-alpha-L-fucosyltransferase FUT6 isoform X2 [Cherax quadricarinatus]|uniref:4-galactosyl-N-acetylglucosaminide 3-alpha-L-fucosyltransferase FUT6 isoform X2 n=1 Tax=Cherax quadricarinatus TaxID=27406 RepID=UPI0023783938|nr:4-galactosyl-N-acetylglucosaminide 3-alpha-L-fucosyltransferase FUT6-like isoform X2 [Cherax quadricarinatus]